MVIYNSHNDYITLMDKKYLHLTCAISLLHPILLTFHTILNNVSTPLTHYMKYIFFFGCYMDASTMLELFVS